MCECDFEPPSAYWQTDRKAKKRHKCSECRGWIEPGEIYRHIRGIWGGDAQTYKQCSDCLSLIAWAEKQSECVCAPLGGAHSAILDDAHDSGDTAYAGEAKRMVQAIRNKRRDLIAA